MFGIVGESLNNDDEGKLGKDNHMKRCAKLCLYFHLHISATFSSFLFSKWDVADCILCM